MEQLKKKVVRLGDLMRIQMEMKKEPEVDEGGGVETNDNELSDMDKLPTEILMKILCYLDEQQLVKVRILSSRWNEICCLLLRENSKLWVCLQPIRGGFGMECKTVITKPFEDFLDCFSPSEAEKSSAHRRRPFPFSCFSITGLNNLESRELLNQFVPLLRYIKFLRLEVTNKETRNFELLWRLLLKFAFNIEHLELAGGRWYEIDFFEPYFNFKANSEPLDTDSDQSQIQDESFLNKLKVLEIQLEKLDWFGRVGGVKTVLNDILKYSPNLPELICHHASRDTILDPLFGQFYLLEVWQQLNRVHLLKKLEIKKPLDGTEKLDDKPADLMKNLQLEELKADCGIFSNPIKHKKSTLNYICHALKSSQNTLSSLDLYNLTIESMNFCFKDISLLSNVHKLQLQILNSVEIGNLLERFSQLCPNITNLNLGRLHGDFSIVAPILWTKFKGLKSLKLSLDVGDNSMALDSTFSGYSKESIDRIQTKLGDGISVEEARQGEQQNPSILDLKDLSRLQLEFLIIRGNVRVPEEVENQLRNSVFVKILPQHIRENPRSILYGYSQ